MTISRASKFCNILFIPLVLFSLPAFSGDIAKGKIKAELCAGCHGLDGISVSPVIPNLAGQKEDYIVLSLKAFKSGSRKNGIMSSIVEAINNDDIDNVAAYFSSLPGGKGGK